MQINPHAWITTLPLLLLVATLPSQPATNPLKRLWAAMNRLEGDVWFSLGCDRLMPDPSRLFAAGSIGYWIVCASLAIGSVLSLLNFMAY